MNTPTMNPKKTIELKSVSTTKAIKPLSDTKKHSSLGLSTLSQPFSAPKIPTLGTPTGNTMSRIVRPISASTTNK